MSDYGEHDIVIFSRRVVDPGEVSEGSVHRTCMGPTWGCRKLVWASRFSVKRERETKASGGACYYMCPQCSADVLPRAAAKGDTPMFMPPSPAEWAEIEKGLSPFEKIKGRLLHMALFGRLPQTGD